MKQNYTMPSMKMQKLRLEQGIAVGSIQPGTVETPRTPEVQEWEKHEEEFIAPDLEM